MNIVHRLNRQSKLYKVPLNNLGLFRTFFSKPNKLAKKYNSEQERIADEIRTQHAEMQEKYYGKMTNKNSEFYYSLQQLEEIEKESIRKTKSVKPFIESYKNEDWAIIKDFIKKGYLEEVTPMSFAEQQEIVQILAQE